MKRAFWFDEAYMNQQMEDVDVTKTRAVHFAKNYNNCSVTENGALGYRKTKSALLDLNFKASSLRNWEEEVVVKDFVKAYYESPQYAVKWLFFLRDILKGMGERRAFRICLKYLALSKPLIVKAVLPYIPEYGRYDDCLVLLDTPLAEDVADMYQKQLVKDLKAMEENEPVSLLGKWLPGINTSSKKTRACAGKLCKYFHMSQREYRKMLAKLRAYGNVAEAKMSASKWGEIAYEKLPAKANMRYDKAFERHDLQRRKEYLSRVYLGDDKLNAKGMMPYEIVHRIITAPHYSFGLGDNLLAEMMWKKITEEGFQNDWGLEDAIVVADGSGSMFTRISGGSSVMAIEICNSLAIYFAQQLKGVFHNKAITFSQTPQFIEFNDDNSLKEKLEIMFAYDEVANTNIEAVFMLILDMAKSKAVPREELPKQVVIISDMEFDEATGACQYGRTACNRSEKLFDSIAARYERNGYKMPRLIFWNVCGRTNTIPKVDNKEGLCLLSGFSQNAMRIASDRTKKDPYDALISVLDSERYQVIDDAIREIVA